MPGSAQRRMESHGGERGTGGTCQCCSRVGLEQGPGGPCTQTPMQRPLQWLLLLLLLLSPSLRGTPDCSFDHSPISSNFAVTISKLVSRPPSPPTRRAVLGSEVLHLGAPCPLSLGVCSSL